MSRKEATVVCLGTQKTKVPEACLSRGIFFQAPRDLTNPRGGPADLIYFQSPELPVLYH